MTYLPVDYQNELDLLALGIRRENRQLLQKLQREIATLRKKAFNDRIATTFLKSENEVLQKENQISDLKFQQVENEYNNAKQCRLMVRIF